jgi:hypothetical protein
MEWLERNIMKYSHRSTIKNGLLSFFLKVLMIQVLRDREMMVGDFH